MFFESPQNERWIARWSMAACCGKNWTNIIRGRRGRLASEFEENSGVDPAAEEAKRTRRQIMGA